MMIGDYPNPTVHVPPWTFPEDLTVETTPPISPHADVDSYTSFFHRYLPSNDAVSDSEGVFGWDPEAYACEQFRMFEFKVRKCTRGGSHDWTECPFAHPGEKARRRDPRKYRYSGQACPEYRKGSCRKGDLCEFAHGVFECWLHPARYRTQPCKDGRDCTRRVCFFAHTQDQLRVLSPNPSPPATTRPESYDGSPQRLALEAASFSKSLPFLSSPDSISPPTESPPMSPMTRPIGINSLAQMVRQLQLNKIKSCSSSWGNNNNTTGLNLGSPLARARARAVFCSLSSTPSGISGHGTADVWCGYDREEEEEVPIMERVESGRDLRAKMFEKLSKENPLDQAEPANDPDSDVDWVSELVN